MTLKDRIRDYILGSDYVSFAELVNRFGDEFAGGEAAIAKGRNLFIWAGMTDAGADAVIDLMADGVIKPWPSVPLVYLVDGHSLAMPIAKRVRDYVSPRWLPVTLRPAAACPPGKVNVQRQSIGTVH